MLPLGDTISFRVLAADAALPIGMSTTYSADSPWPLAPKAPRPPVHHRENPGGNRGHFALCLQWQLVHLLRLLAGLASRRSRKPVSRLPHENPDRSRMRRKSEIFVLMPPTKYSLSARCSGRSLLRAIRAVADQLGQQRIVVDGNGPAFIHAAIAADSRPGRREQQA